MSLSIYFKSHFILPKVKLFSANRDNTCIVSVVNDSFADYFSIFAQSIKEHNGYFNYDWIIYYGKSKNNQLSAKSMKKMSEAYDNIIFKEINEEDYKRFENLVPSNLFPSLFKLELFRLKQYSKIVCLDVDTLCLGDISFLFKHDFTFAATVSGSDYDKHIAMQNYYNRNHSWNAGIVVYGKNIISDAIYEDLMKTNYYCEFAEQTILNNYFRYFPKYLLPFNYNFHALFFNEKIESSDVRILHYAGPKPTDEPELPQMQYWLKAKQRYL